MTLSGRFDDAFCLAHRLHATQVRKGANVPYVAHLMAVASIVIEHGGTEDEAIAALLHDSIEDQGGATVRVQIRREFGDVVAAIVDGCTDADSVPKPPWRPRKEAYIAHLATATDSVRLVSAADKLHNVRAILTDYLEHGDAVWSRFNVGRDEILWYYRALVSTFRRFDPTPLTNELDRTVTDLERLVEIGSAAPSAT